MKQKMKSFLNNMYVGDSPNPLRFEFSGIMRFIPLIVCGGFFLFTILIFAFGPLDWNINNPFQLYTFLILCCVSLILGYSIAIKKGKTAPLKLNLNINNLLITCSIVYFIIYIPTLLVTTGKWYPDIVEGILDTGKAYRNTKFLNENSSQFALYIRMLLSPFLIMVTPVTLFFMPKLSKLGKVLGWIVIVLTVCMSISQGMNKACADFTAQIVLFLCMLFFTKNRKKEKKSIQKHSYIFYRLRMLLVILSVCILFFVYYSTTMHNRVSTDLSNNDNSQETTSSEDSLVGNVDDSITSYSTFGFSTIKEDYLLFKVVPKRLQPTAMFLSSYISHGYKGLSIAMEEEFTSTYGLGFSDFFRHNFLKIVGETESEKEIISQTYYGKTSDSSWETGSFWSTFFVYPASDISFIGTILLVFLIGYLFALSWKDALSTENPFAITTFFCFCTMIFYFSANNQMFQGGENFIGFSSMLILWAMSRCLIFKKAKKA